MANRWAGCTVACIASGPSLTAEDCWRVEAAGVPAIAVNTSWQLARFADVIYAGDAAWWQAHIGEIDVPAERWTCSENAAHRFGLNWHRVRGPYNSGLRAIELALDFGASRILLLGYDCTVSRGTHWHGQHERTKNPNEERCALWRRQFALLDKRGVEILNCTRETTLTCFPRMSLEEALAC